MKSTGPRRTIALTHLPSPHLARAELSFVERTEIDLELANKQHEAYTHMLADCGAEVHVLDVNSAYPDCVFIEDTAVVLEDVAIIASPGAVSRRKEPSAIADVLLQWRELRRIALPATLDGGDVTVHGKTVLVGMSQRTNAAGVAAMKELLAPLGYDVRAVEIQGCLHLKSACTTLPDNRLLINPKWIRDPASLGEEVVEIPADEPFAADVAVVNGIVVQAAAFPRTIEMLEKMHYRVRAVDLSEFAKAEGGVTCLSLIFKV